MYSSAENCIRSLWRKLHWLLAHLFVHCFIRPLEMGHLHSMQSLKPMTKSVREAKFCTSPMWWQVLAHGWLFTGYSPKRGMVIWLCFFWLIFCSLSLFEWLKLGIFNLVIDYLWQILNINDAKWGHFLFTVTRQVYIILYSVSPDWK